MFDDIIKKKYDLDVIRRDLEVYFGFLKYEIMDTITLNHIILDVNAYLSGYYGMKPAGVSFDFDKKKVIISFDNKTIMFPVGN